MKGNVSSKATSVATKYGAKEEVKEGTVKEAGTSVPFMASLRVRHLTQNIAFGILWLTGIVAVAVLLAVVGYVMKEGIQVINIEFLTTNPEGGLDAAGGILSTIVTTIYLVALTIIIAAPLGVGAGIYLVEYTGDVGDTSSLTAKLVGVVRFGVETLAGVPSIIFGLFGYALFVAMMKFGFSIMSAALAGSCLILPVVIRTTEEALRTVPRAYREGSLALGATQWQTIWEVVLPAAIPGIITGIVLSVGRIISETAIFYVTLGGSANLPKSVFSSGRTMALHVYYLAMDTRAFDKSMGTAAILVLTIIIINAGIGILSRRWTAKLKGR